MILVCGGLADGVTELVCARLEALEYPYRLLDLGLFPEGYEVAWRWSAGEPSGTVRGPGWRLNLAELSGVFVRYLGSDGHAPVAGFSGPMAEALIAESQAGVMALLEHLPCLVVNRAAPSVSNHSKPYQALMVRQVGLQTPPTLVTSDPEAALGFYQANHGEVIFKSLSGVRSVVRKLKPSDLERLPLLRHGAAQFQRFLPGDNVRVHTVGDEVFATRVRSEAVDYRYARRQGHAAEMEPTDLPDSVAEACLRLARAAGLVIAGIDLKQTPEDEWYCFEINPCPGFAYYEQNTGQPISAALAELLKAGLRA
jgi:glutathione synthase/RimK-type ligase-like ATP-grasp enzyme